MIEARDLIQKGRHSVSAAGLEVSYESPTHFSRDYTRNFDVFPVNDVRAANAISQEDALITA
ncbi:hypothetical protein J4E70_11295 [Pseudohalocynthiibacter aestuariivivens]|jgi:transcriptional regulator GlxA family with amidase domain|nr:hypothetical protein [Pseudohalocynthiibacter aestuariivivens]MCK0102132.1 hypothetical protein [Pseudohalocynthiibacter sp. F2068]